MKRTLVLVLSFLAVGMLFTGCFGGKKQAEPATQDMYVDPELVGAPKWIRMPYIEGSIADVGAEKRNAGSDFSYQRNQAISDGTMNLSRQIERKAKSMIKRFKSATGTGTDATFDSASEEVSKDLANQTIHGVKVKDTWISQSGTLYVWVYIDTESIVNEMEKQIKTSFKNEQAMQQQFMLHKKSNELEDELEKAGMNDR
jgi:hypothetical protein